MRASYDIAEAFPGALVIMDLDKGKTVTNDIDNVLIDLQRIYGPLGEYKIMYKDTQGIYDGIRHDNGRFLGFVSLNEKDGMVAYNKLMQKLLS